MIFAIFDISPLTVCVNCIFMTALRSRCRHYILQLWLYFLYGRPA